MLSRRQLNHVERIREAFSSMMATKYEIGAKEHGGDLQDVSELKLVDSAIEEAIDQFVYLWTLREKIVKRVDSLESQSRHE